jgi:hypothetical protein
LSLNTGGLLHGRTSTGRNHWELNTPFGATAKCFRAAVDASRRHETQRGLGSYSSTKGEPDPCYFSTKGLTLVIPQQRVSLALVIPQQRVCLTLVNDLVPMPHAHSIITFIRFPHSRTSSHFQANECNHLHFPLPMAHPSLVDFLFLFFVFVLLAASGFGQATASLCRRSMPSKPSRGCTRARLMNGQSAFCPSPRFRACAFDVRICCSRF